jgi:hypothetical protein
MVFCILQSNFWNSTVRQNMTTKGKNTHTAACDLIRGNKSVDLFPRIKSQAAGRSAVCVFLSYVSIIS